MNQMLSTSAVVVFVGLASPAVAAERVQAQQSASFPNHTAIPEKFGTPIRERFDEMEDLRREVPMPIPAPGRTIDRDPPAREKGDFQADQKRRHFGLGFQSVCLREPALGRHWDEKTVRRSSRTASSPC